MAFVIVTRRGRLCSEIGAFLSPMLPKVAAATPPVDKARLR